MPGVIPADPGATSMGMTEKDIFEDTDFSLEVDALDSDHDDRTMQIDRSSDFDLEESDSASEVFALDEDDVDQNAATAMGAAVADDESGEFAADDGGSGEMASGWDVESDGGGRRRGRPRRRRRRPGSCPPAPRPSGAASGSACSGPPRSWSSSRWSSRSTWSATSTSSRAAGPASGLIKSDRRPLRLRPATTAPGAAGSGRPPGPPGAAALVVPKGVGTPMVERPRPALAAALALAGALLGPGCAFVPKSRFDEAQKLVQSLRSENAQLKDSTLTLKVQNQDLAQRAVDDAKAIRALEVANDQYERSIQGYQDEREQLQAAFRELKGQVRTASGP